MSSCQRGRSYSCSRMYRRSTLEMKASGKDELYTCARDDSCQSNWLQRILNTIPLGIHRDEISTKRLVKRMRASTGGWMFGVRATNWASCGVSNMSRWKNVICKLSSRGASIRATRSSKYSLTPLNQKKVRAGKGERVCGCGRRTGRDRGDLNPIQRPLRLVNVERQRTIAS